MGYNATNEWYEWENHQTIAGGSIYVLDFQRICLVEENHSDRKLACWKGVLNIQVKSCNGIGDFLPRRFQNLKQPHPKDLSPNALFFKIESPSAVISH